MYVRQSSPRQVVETLEGRRRQYERVEWAAAAQGEVGIVVALEVTRLSRNSPDWHHLLYLCRFTEMLIG